MNKEEPYRDQAERLRKRVQKLNEEQIDGQLQEGLPPRSQVHQQQKTRTRVRLKYPIIRILALFFILLPIVSYSIYTLNKAEPEQTANLNEQEEDSSVEPVQVEDEDEKAVEEDETKGEEAEAPPVEDDRKETVDDFEKNENVPPAPEENKKNEPKQGSTSEVSEKDKPKQEYIYHKVQPGENLYRISLKYFRSPAGIDRIKKANGIKGTEILVGQTLKIPVQ